MAEYCWPGSISKSPSILARTPKASHILKIHQRGGSGCNTRLEPLVLLRCSFPSLTYAAAFPVTQGHPTGDRVLLENQYNRKKNNKNIIRIWYRYFLVTSVPSKPLQILYANLHVHVQRTFQHPHDFQFCLPKYLHVFRGLTWAGSEIPQINKGIVEFISLVTRSGTQRL